jgi:hypothetical protein
LDADRPPCTRRAGANAAEIEAAVGACSVLLAVIGPRWLTVEGDSGRQLDDPQDWVRLDIEAAIQRRVPIIPVLIDDARMPGCQWRASPYYPASTETRRERSASPGGDGLRPLPTEPGRESPVYAAIKR